AMSPDFVVAALTGGIMQGPGAALAPPQRVALAEYLTGKKMAGAAAMAGRGTGEAPAFSLAGSAYNGWGANPENWRFQAAPGIAANELAGLEGKWAFGFPGARAAFWQANGA